MDGAGDWVFNVVLGDGLGVAAFAGVADWLLGADFFEEVGEDLAGDADLLLGEDFGVDLGVNGFVGVED